MAKRRFKTDLTVSGINNLKAELINYKNNILQSKLNLFTRRLAEIGLNVANVKISESPLGKYVSVKIETKSLNGESIAFLIANGQTVQSEGYEPFNILLGIEFGSGIHYNKDEINPYANELGFGYGTFPGQLHALKDEGWYYWDAKTETWKHSYGIKATMPMYNAYIQMLQQIQTIAREVFGK